MKVYQNALDVRRMSFGGKNQSLIVLSCVRMLNCNKLLLH